MSRRTEAVSVLSAKTEWSWEEITSKWRVLRGVEESKVLASSLKRYTVFSIRLSMLIITCYDHENWCVADQAGDVVNLVFASETKDLICYWIISNLFNSLPN